MKKLLFALAIISFASVSCMKERDCVCKDKDGNEKRYPFPKNKKSIHKDACDLQAAWDDYASCELD